MYVLVENCTRFPSSSHELICRNIIQVVSGQMMSGFFECDQVTT
jgi:hypothetical protein